MSMEPSMKNFLKNSLAVGVGAFFAFSASSAMAATPGACDQVVQSIKNEWKAVDYHSPSKPTELRVVGKLGHENTASQVAYMQQQIKLADSDCRSGDAQSAVQRVSSIHDMLDSHGISPATANAAMMPQ
jgi:hypothetical protein